MVIKQYSSKHGATARDPGHYVSADVAKKTALTLSISMLTLYYNMRALGLPRRNMCTCHWINIEILQCRLIPNGNYHEHL